MKKLVVKEDQEQYPGFAFFFNEEVCFMRLNLENGYLWYSYEKIWLVFEKELKYNYEEIQNFIKNMLEQHFNNKEITLKPDIPLIPCMLEQHFNNKEITLNPPNDTRDKLLEQHFKYKEVKSLTVAPVRGNAIEQYFKNKETLKNLWLYHEHI